MLRKAGSWLKVIMAGSQVVSRSGAKLKTSLQLGGRYWCRSDLVTLMLDPVQNSVVYKM